MKSCGRCGENKELKSFNRDKYTKTGYRSQCKECMRKERSDNRAYYKAYRETPEKKEWYAKYRRDRYHKDMLKVKARNAARALDRGLCEVCGLKEDIHAHHDDYTKPLDVRWLCGKHHKEWHSENDPVLVVAVT